MSPPGPPALPRWPPCLAPPPPPPSAAAAVVRRLSEAPAFEPGWPRTGPVIYFSRRLTPAGGEVVITTYLSRCRTDSECRMHV